MTNIPVGGTYPSATNPWWGHDGLQWSRQGDGPRALELDGRCLATVARRHGTPCYVYSGARISQKFRALSGAAASVTPRHRIFYAMKANRNPYVLAWIRQLGSGVDVCSGAELRVALEAGFSPAQISFTSVGLTPADLALLAQCPGVSANADSIQQIRQLAAASPGRALGLRINPRAGFGYTENLQYASDTKVTKFGIYLEAFEEALEVARQLGLRIRGLHCHSGWGLQQRGLAGVARITSQLLPFIEICNQRALPLDYINLGGGLGTPLKADDRPVDLADWAAIIREQLGRVLNGRAELYLEPGDFLVRDSGVLLSRVLATETKAGINFAVLDASFAVNLQQAAYSLPMNAVKIPNGSLEPAETTTDTAPPGFTRAAGELRYRLAGSINEAVDVFAPDLMLPPLSAGDLIAFTATGAYGASMSSNHCLRGHFTEVFLPAAA